MTIQNSFLCIECLFLADDDAAENIHQVSLAAKVPG